MKVNGGDDDDGDDDDGDDDDDDSGGGGGCGDNDDILITHVNEIACRPTIDRPPAAYNTLLQFTMESSQERWPFHKAQP